MHLRGGAAENETYYDIKLKTSSLGNYEVAVKAYERPSYEVLPIIGNEYFATSEEKYKTEVDNTNPGAVYKAKTISKVDVVFAVGELRQESALQTYIQTFSGTLNKSVNNIDAKVEQVQTSSIDITSQDPSVILSTWQAWTQHPGGSVTSWSYIPSSMAIQDDVYHCNRQGYRDKVNSTAGDFVLETNIVGYQHKYNDVYGLTFRHSASDEHYAIVWQDIQGSSCGMYAGQVPVGLSLIKASSHTFGTAVAVNSAIGGWRLGQHWNLKVEMKESTINIYIDGVLRLTYTDPQPYTTGTYGVVAVSHGTGQFSGIKLTSGGTKTLGEAISDVSWRDGSVRFIVHATDVITKEGLPGNNSDLVYTVTKLLNSNAYLINLGNSTNKAALDKILNSIIQANGTIKGTHINNTPITTAMDKSAEYIINIAKNLSKPTDWVLVDTEILWNTEYKDSERDLPLNFGEHDGRHKQPQDTSDITLANSWGLGLTNLYTSNKSLAEKWRYKHEPTFFDNSNIQVSFHNAWITDPIESFENTGKYRINYKRRDNPLHPNVSLENAFDSYRYWSTDYDRRE